MIFRSAYLKLTIFYVLIVMFISLVFSGAIYRISSLEIGRGLNRQAGIFRQIPPDQHFPVPLQELEKIRREQTELSNNHLAMNLIYFNILIFVLSAAGSYFFAKKTLRPIEEMMDAQNRFTADASHELKTPLTAMRSEIEVNLRDKKLNLNSAEKLLASNLEEIDKLESLSSALLRLAKYKEETKLNFENLSLSDLVTAAYEKVATLADKKNIEFRNKFENVAVHGDKDSLTELFVILLDNAIKYSPKNSIINIKIEKEGKHAVVKIADRGVGIKESDLPHIFDRFYRADQSRNKEKADGYGLGLSIAKQIVELHSGEISAQSELGKGSTFIVKLSA